MADEKPAPLPLNGDEVKEAILYKINESLGRTCHLSHDNAYASFMADISIRLKLNDFGREQRDNHIVQAMEPANIPAEELEQMRSMETNLTIVPAPPNVVRTETNQPVPVPTLENGKRVIKPVRYAPRKRNP